MTKYFVFILVFVAASAFAEPENFITGIVNGTYSKLRKKHIL